MRINALLQPDTLGAAKPVRAPTRWALQYQPDLHFRGDANNQLTWSDFPSFWISNLDVDPIPTPIQHLHWVWIHGTYKNRFLIRIRPGVDALGQPTGKRSYLNQYLWELKNQKLVAPKRRLKTNCGVMGCFNPLHWILSASGPGPDPDPVQSSVALQNVSSSAEDSEFLANMLDSLEPQPRTKAEAVARIVEKGFFSEGEVLDLFETLPSKGRYQ